MWEVILTPKGVAVRDHQYTSVSWSPTVLETRLDGEVIGLVSEQQGIFLWACWAAGATTSLLSRPHFPEDIPTALLLSLNDEETVVPMKDPPLPPGPGE